MANPPLQTLIIDRLGYWVLKVRMWHQCEGIPCRMLRGTQWVPSPQAHGHRRWIAASHSFVLTEAEVTNNP